MSKHFLNDPFYGRGDYYNHKQNHFEIKNVRQPRQYHSRSNTKNFNTQKRDYIEAKDNPKIAENQSQWPQSKFYLHKKSIGQLNGLLQRKQNRQNNSLHVLSNQNYIARKQLKNYTHSNPNFNLQNFSSSLNKMDYRSLYQAKQQQANKLNQMQEINKNRQMYAKSINPSASLDFLQRELNDLLHHQRQKKRIERQKYFTNSVLKPQLAMVKKKYDKQKQQIINQLHELRSKVQQSRLQKQLEEKSLEKALEKMQKIILPALQNQQAPPTQPPLPFQFVIPPQSSYTYNQNLSSKTIKKSTKNLKRKFKAATYVVIFSIFFQKYSINFTRNRVKFWLEKNSRPDINCDFLSQKNIKILIEKLNVPEICLNVYRGFYNKQKIITLNKQKRKKLQKQHQAIKEDSQQQGYQKQMERNKRKKTMKYVQSNKSIIKRSQSKSKSKNKRAKIALESQQKFVQQQFFIELNISSKFILHFLNKLTFQIEKNDMLSPFYETMAKCFLDRAFILDQFLLIQQLRSINFHAQKGYAKIKKSQEKALIAFNVIIKMFLAPILMMYQEGQSVGFSKILAYSQNIFEAQFLSGQIGLNTMIIFAIFNQIFQEQISEFSAKQGNFLFLKSNLQTLPSTPLAIINGLMQEQFGGKDTNGKIHKHITNLLGDVAGTASFKELINSYNTTLVQDSKVYINRIVDFVHKKLKQAKKKQYQIVKNMTFNDLNRKYWKQYDMTVFQIRNQNASGDSPIIQDYLDSWGTKLRLGWSKISDQPILPTIDASSNYRLHDNSRKLQKSEKIVSDYNTMSKDFLTSKKDLFEKIKSHKQKKQNDLIDDFNTKINRKSNRQSRKQSKQQQRNKSLSKKQKEKSKNDKSNFQKQSEQKTKTKTKDKKELKKQNDENKENKEKDNEPIIAKILNLF